jgi:intein/homing endonuclease
VTKQHPFLTNKKDSDVWAWVDTPDLEVGDYLKHINGDKVEITSIVYVGDPIYVKTLDVEEVDNYTAGNMAVVIHNDVPNKS